jgi:glycosyltransferase involved in cell wall biosynthesis
VSQSLALVHDYLYVYGGAERTLEHVHQIWPAAPLYTLLYVPERLPGSWGSWDIRTTWVNALPARFRLQRWYALLQPLAFGRLRVRDARALLSFASFGAKAVPAPQGGKHLCYCYTPPRFLWGPHSGTDRSRWPAPARLASKGLNALLRRWDWENAQRVDSFITQSRYVRDRIRRVYDRDSVVVHPPVDVARYASLGPREGSYFLGYGRFEAYKRFDLAIRACQRAGAPLWLVGGGVDEARLRRIAVNARADVRFLGSLDDAALVEVLAGCRAVLFPGEEDFGLVAVEAQAAGKPVIAYGAGGALETVIDGVTGTFFHQLTVEALAETLASFDPARFDPQEGRDNAARFAPGRFKQQLKLTVDGLLSG